MENNLDASPHGETPSRASLLASLDADRAQLSKRMKSPRWLAPAFGLLAGLEVASAAFPDTVLDAILGPLLVVAGVMFVVLYSRSIGVRISAWTPAAWFLLAAALVVTLTFYSVARGLESFTLVWWIALPAVAAFLVVTGLVTVMLRSLVDRVLRVR